MKTVADIKTTEDLKEYLQIDTIVRGHFVYIEAYRKLRELIIGGYYKKGDKFLSEAELAGIMGIGRTSLRTALAVLYEDGYLKTYQGKGTYVVYDPPLATKAYPDKYMLPRARLAEVSDHITVLHDRQNPLDYDAFLDEKLEANGSKLVLFQRTYSVDDVSPAINLNCYYPASLFPDLDYKNYDLTEKMLEQLFEEKVSYVTCTFTPAPSSLPRQVPNVKYDSENFVLVSSLWYGHDNKPILFCKDHYNGNIIRFRAKFYK